METQRERLIRYLDDAWAVERMLGSMLQDASREVNDPQVAQVFDDHRRETRQQEMNLETRLRALGEEPSGVKGFFNQMLAKFGDLMQITKDDYDRTTQDLMRAYAMENFELAMYQALESYSVAIGDAETAELARRHMEQERATAEKLWPLIAPAATRAAHPIE